MYNFYTEKNIKIANRFVEYLKEGPNTSSGIAKDLGVTQIVALHYLRHLEEMGQVYVCEYTNFAGKGLAKVFAFGNKPSAEKKDYLSPNYRQRKRKSKIRQFVAKPDIAAAWMNNPC